MGMTIRQMKARYSNAKNEKKLEEYRKALKLSEKGYSNEAIARELGYAGESSVRSLLDKNRKDRNLRTTNTANALEEAIKNQGPIDISSGVGLCSSAPRGDGNDHLLSRPCEAHRGLCSSAPRGDGNPTRPDRTSRYMPTRFMQLSPARGRKHPTSGTTPRRLSCGLCSSAPRGDGNKRDIAILSIMSI